MPQRHNGSLNIKLEMNVRLVELVALAVTLRALFF